MKDADFINTAMSLITSPEQRHEAIRENIKNMDNKTLDAAREVAQGLLNFEKEDLKLMQEGAQHLAKSTKELFKHLGSPPNLLNAVKKTNADDLFEIIQTAKTTGVFEKLDQMTPSSRINSKEHKEYKEFIKALTSHNSPDQLKEFFITQLENPKNASAIKDLTAELTIAIKHPKIKKLVNTVTNPKLISTAFSVMKSRAGKNFTKVLADKKSSRSKIIRAYARLAFTAIGKFTLHTKKIIEAGIVLNQIQQDTYKSQLENNNNKVMSDMIRANLENIQKQYPTANTKDIKIRVNMPPNQSKGNART